MKKLILLISCVAMFLTMFGCKIEFPEDNTDIVTSEITSLIEDETQSFSQENTTEKETTNEISTTTEISTEVEDTTSTTSISTTKSETTKVSTTAPTTTEKATQVATTESTTKVEDNKQYCTISINCSTILNNMDNLDPSKTSLIPNNGVILSSKKVEIKDGDTVYDVLNSVTKKYGIHMETSTTPALGSKYIEGIYNIYEFDCGPFSGWLFSVNGTVASVSVSSYKVNEGDNIKILYTCSLGDDL